MQGPLVSLRQKARFRPACLLAAFTIAFLLLWLAAYIIETVRDQGDRKDTGMSFQEIGLGVTNYSMVFGHLPFPVRQASPGRSVETGSANGAGRPLYSWRVEIVPYLESWHGSWDKSQAWNSAANKELLELSSFYAYDAARQSGAKDRTFPDANALAITGPGTAFADINQRPMALKDVPPNTILVVESRASGIPWPAPGDFDIRTMPQTINRPDGKGISSRHAGGFHVIFADGMVWFISDKVPFDTLRKFFTIADAKKYDRDDLLGPYALDGRK